MFDVIGELTEIPGDHFGVQSLIERFINSWCDPLDDKDGFAEEYLTPIEHDLRVVIPGALRSIYRTMGRREDLVSVHDPLLHPSNLRMDGPDMLVFREENQLCTSWAVPTTESLDDPPVYYRDWGGAWMPYQDRLSVDLLEMVISESALSSGRDIAFLEITPDISHILGNILAPLAFPGHVFWPMPDSGHVRWYGASDALVRRDADMQIMAFALTSESLEKVERLIPGNWWHLSR